MGKGPTREQVLRDRGILDASRRLLKLTLPEYRALLARRFDSLPFSAEERQDHVAFAMEYGPLPRSPRFWEILTETLRRNEGPLAHLPWNYRERYGRKAPALWAEKAAQVAAGMTLLQGQIVGISGRLRQRWETHGDIEALVAMARADGVRSEWARKAITTLRHRQFTGPPAERKVATVQLKAVCKALSGVGRAGRDPVSADQRTPRDVRRARNLEDARRHRARKMISERLTGYQRDLSGGLAEPAARQGALRRLRAKTRAALLRKLRTVSKEVERPET